jgi:hypothetical protein
VRRADDLLVLKLVYKDYQMWDDFAPEKVFRAIGKAVK